MKTKNRKTPSKRVSRSIDDWEREWRTIWNGDGTSRYELPALPNGDGERQFRVETRTPQKEAERLNRIHAEFVRGFKALYRLGPAGAGMCNGGRVLHHLKQNLWKSETQVLIVGYQGRGSLGRLLVDGAKDVRIHGEKVAVRAKVHTIGGFSAHAGQSDQLKWFGHIAPSKPRVALTHGEDGPRKALARQIEKRFRTKCELPPMNDVIEV